MVQPYPDKQSMAVAAAQYAAKRLLELLQKKASVRLVAATGASQLSFLQELTRQQSLDWVRIELFHLDEYIGIGADHPASFARYIRERIVEPMNISRYLLLDGQRDPQQVISEANAAIAAAPVDLAFVGIGENAHLAFNDPPADFDTEDPYLVVQLDEACRRQQLGEGWFTSIEEVPRRAISMSVRQILKSREIICVVPDRRKARAVAACFEGEISPNTPASILRTHEGTTVYLDQDSAALLTPASSLSRV